MSLSTHIYKKGSEGSMSFVWSLHPSQLRSQSAVSSLHYRSICASNGWPCFVFNNIPVLTGRHQRFCFLLTPSLTEINSLLKRNKNFTYKGSLAIFLGRNGVLVLMGVKLTHGALIRSALL